MFETKQQAEVEARKKNDARTVNPKTGKLGGIYKVYEAKQGDKVTYAVAKSPAGAAAHVAVAFGIEITGDKKAVVVKMKPKDYLALLGEEELAELDKERAALGA